MGGASLNYASCLKGSSMRHLRFVPAAVLMTFLAASSAFAVPFKVDPAHSSVSFTVQHIFSQVHGQFNSFDGAYDFDAKTKAVKDVTFTIKAASLTTNHAKRDAHLNSPDFFNTAEFPDIQFKAEKISRSKNGSYRLTGPLTLHGVTKSVTFTGKFLGQAKNPWGQTVSAFSAATTISRKDFGMLWNKTLDNGGFLVGNDVEVTVAIEGAAVTAPETGK